MFAIPVMAMAVVLLLELPVDDPLQRVIDMRRNISALDVEIQTELFKNGRAPQTDGFRWTCYDNRMRSDFPLNKVFADGKTDNGKGVMCLGCYREERQLFHVFITRAESEGSGINAGRVHDLEAMDETQLSENNVADLRKVALSALQTNLCRLLEYTHLEALVPIDSAQTSTDANITIRDYRDASGSVSRYSFDAQQGNQIVRFVRFRPADIPSGIPFIEVETENQQLGSSGTWFPRKVVFQVFSNDTERKLKYEERSAFRIVSFDRDACERRLNLNGIEILRPDDKLLVISKDGSVTKTWDGSKLVSPPEVKTEGERQRVAVAAAQKPAATDWMSWGGVALGAALIGAGVYFALGNRRQQ